MKTIISFSLIALISFELQAQDKYVIQFADKNNSPYSISNPLDYVSQRSIDRRFNQNILFTVSDLPVNPAYLQSVASTGAIILNNSKWLNTVTIQTSDTNILNSILLLPFVQNLKNVGRPISNNSETEKQKFKFKNNEVSPFASVQNKLSGSSALNYGPAFHQVNMMNGDYLHDNGFTGAGMLIAVIDAGFFNADIMTALDSLKINNQILATYDFVDHQTNVYDDNWHGSNCLSIMGANEPGIMVGCAPHADYILLRSEDVNSELLIEEYNWASAAEFADSMGADVLSTSLVYYLFDDSTQNHSYATLDGNTAPITIAADLAASKGMLVVNAAGNEGGSNWNYICVPADADSILAIGAVDSLEQYAGFSSNGPTFDGRVKPEVSCMGAGTYTVSPWDGSVNPGNGTSFACPLLAGLAACYWQKNPTLTNMQVRQFIIQSASQYLSPDTLLGFGIPDFISADLLLNVFENEKGSDQLLVYPNPVGSEIWFTHSKSFSGNALCKIMDATGKVVVSNPVILNNNLKYNLKLPKHIQPGFYFLQIQTETEIRMTGFVKM